MKKMGADVTVVGALEHAVPGDVAVLGLVKPKSRLVRFVIQPWRCLWAIRDCRPDIVHFHDPEILATLPLARLWWPRTRFVYDVHEDFANLMLIRDWLPPMLKPIVKALTNGVEKLLARLAHGIVGVTPPLADKFSNRERIVAYNYIAGEFFTQAERLAIEPRRRRYDLGHVGTLNLRRAHFLAEVLRRYHEARPQARSLLIGVSPEIRNAMAAALPAGCTVLGKVPHGEIAGLLADVKVGLDVHPWLGAHLEVALPVKVCEYMAAGCAVVSSSMPVLERVLAEAGIGSADLRLIEGGAPADYAQAACSLAQAIERGENPGARLRARAAAHLTWETQAAQVGRLYRRLVEGKCAG
jgi:glycosyltransferase involved in cell wall biosynthesis